MWRIYRVIADLQSYRYTALYRQILIITLFYAVAIYNEDLICRGKGIMFQRNDTLYTQIASSMVKCRPLVYPSEGLTNIQEVFPLWTRSVTYRKSNLEHWTKLGTPPKLDEIGLQLIVLNFSVLEKNYFIMQKLSKIKIDLFINCFYCVPS